MDKDDVMFLLKVSGIIIGFLVVIFLLICIPIWFSSCRSARIYNQRNNASYTCSDFFWAGDQVNSQSQTIKLVE